MSVLLGYSLLNLGLISLVASDESPWTEYVDSAVRIDLFYHMLAANPLLKLLLGFRGECFRLMCVAQLLCQSNYGRFNMSVPYFPKEKLNRLKKRNKTFHLTTHIW